jgi:hypothetical protein
MTPVAELQRTYSPADVQAMVDAAQRDADVFVADNDVIVNDRVTLEQAARVRSAIGTKVKSLKGQIAEPKAWAKNLHTWFCGLEKTAVLKYEQLDTRLAGRIRTFKEEEDRRRVTRERELSLQIKKDADTRAVDTAAHLAASGQQRLADQVIAQAVSTPAQPVTLEDHTKVANQAWVRRWLWRWTVNDKPDTQHAAIVGTGESLADVVERLLDRIPDENLLAALGPALEAEKQLVPRSLLCLDETKINGLVRSMKEGAVRVLPACLTVYYVDDPVRR